MEHRFSWGRGGFGLIPGKEDASHTGELKAAALIAKIDWEHFATQGHLHQLKLTKVMNIVWQTITTDARHFTLSSVHSLARHRLHIFFHEHCAGIQYA